MNWEAIGEIVGAIAVVVTLVYLTIQLRHNTAQSIENTRVLRRSEMAANFEQWFP